MKKLNNLAKNGKINTSAGIRDSQSIIINTSIDKVWGVLSDIDKWSEWNSGIEKVQLKDKLKNGARFTWKQGRIQGNSEIQKIEKPISIAWTSRANWGKRIFVWSLDSSDENQTIATVSASLQGALVAFVENHHKLHHELLNWLECLKVKLEEE